MQSDRRGLSCMRHLLHAHAGLPWGGCCCKAGGAAQQAQPLQHVQHNQRGQQPCCHFRA